MKANPVDKDDYAGRPCERCRDEITDPTWKYGWCEECCEKGTCRHGNAPEDCEPCFIESDCARSI